ncbi:MAG: hypothetical protein QOJ72_353 [Nocardioidaceae bacterium]|nr:hypothetical protein [Nocardioidaceae bacterium]
MSDPDPRYRYLGLVIAAVVVVANVLYHVSWWNDFH